MNQQLLALQGIANGSDELGNLLLLDRNEQRDELNVHHSCIFVIDILMCMGH